MYICLFIYTHLYFCVYMYVFIDLYKYMLSVLVVSFISSKIMHGSY